jgi:hypothetical protein
MTMKKKLAVMLLLGTLMLAVVSVWAAEKAAPDKDYLQIGFGLMKNETIGNLAVGISESELLTLLGEAEQKSTAKVWAADGNEHQSWFYPSKGIDIDMVERRDGMPVVGRVTIVSPCTLKTKRGIGIGSTAQEVQIAYKDEINPESIRENSSLVAGTVYGGIIFSLKDGVVSRIFSGAAAE